MLLVFGVVVNVTRILIAHVHVCINNMFYYFLAACPRVHNREHEFIAGCTAHA